MALAERDLNLTRRNSKSSAYSGSIKDTPPYNSSGTPDAVLSMLKTSTETGDIGSFSATPSRFPRLPNALSRRPKQNTLVASSSRASSHYSRAGSVRSAKSQRSARDNASDTAVAPYTSRRYASSQDFVQANTSSFAEPDGGRSLTMTSTGFLDHGPDRAYSLTQEPPLHRSMADNRSMSSMRSQGHGWPNRPRSPFVMANRLNSSHRPVSPALSDIVYTRRPPPRPSPGPRSFTSGTPPPRYYPDMNTPHMPPMNPSMGLRMPVRPTRAFEDLRRPFQYGMSPPPYVEPLDHRQRRPPPLHYVESGRQAYPASTLRRDFTPLQDLNAPPLSTGAYSGFVQRVKNVLEERISTDEACSPTGSVRGRGSPTVLDPDRTAPLSVVNAETFSLSNASQTAEPDSNELTGQVKEGEDGSAAAAALAALAAVEEVVPLIEQDDPSVKRLTRDLIKAGMDGMSDIAEVSDVGIDVPMDPSLDYEPRKSSSPEGNLFKVEGSTDIPGAFPMESTSVKSAHIAPQADQDLESQLSSELPRRDSAKLKFRRSMLRSGIADQEESQENQRQGSEASARVYQRQDDLTRPFSMPHRGLSSDSRETKISQFKSMPPPSHSRMSLSTTVLDSDSEDDQKAIRLSSIQPDSQQSSAPQRGVSDSIVQEQTSPEGRSIKARRNSSAPVPSSTELISQSITVSAPTTISTSTTPRAPVRSSLGPDSGRLVPSASRSGALSIDQRASAIRNFNAPLPDLTEDSQEDASTTNLRMLGMKAPMFRPRQIREYRPPSRLSLESPAAASPTYPSQPVNALSLPPSGYLNARFADTRNIPSFNFSRVDLTTKLNKALGYRLSRSFEDFTQGSIRTGDVSNEDRPMSSNMARERYRSFFVFDESSEEGEDPDKIADQILDSTIKSTTRSLAIDQHILNEIDRLSIPSVKHLTSRLSQLLPNIKQSQTEGDLNKVDEALKDTLNELKAMGAAEKAQAAEVSDGPTRRGTVTSTSSSQQPVRRRDCPFRLNKELPPLPDDGIEHGEDRQDDSSAGDSLATAPEHTASEDCEQQAGADSEAEGTAVDNTTSTMLDDTTKQLETAVVAETPQKALAETSRQEATPRPWNHQESYPWSNKTPPIKLNHKASVGHVDPDTMEDAAPAAEGLDTTEALHVVRSMSPGFNDANLVPVSGNDTGKETPSSSRKGLLKSLTQIVGLKSKASRPGASIDPHFLHPEEAALSETPSQSSSRRVDHGDRYPTTSLIAPDGVQVDAVAPLDDGNRSFFSNDSSISDRQSGGGFRRRLTRFRVSRSNAQLETGQQQSETGSHSGAHRVMIGSQQAVNVQAYTDIDSEPLPGGMSKTEYRAKRLVEKLRYLIYKGGERLKNLTTPKKRGRFWYETTASEDVLRSH